MTFLWNFLTAPVPVWAFLLLAWFTVKWYTVIMAARMFYVTIRLTILYRRMPTMQESLDEYTARWGL